MASWRMVGRKVDLKCYHHYDLHIGVRQLKDFGSGVGFG